MHSGMCFRFSREMRTSSNLQRSNQRWSPRGRPWPREHILESLASASKVKSLALASKPQVLENCPVLCSKTALLFEQLKFCWKTSETSRKIYKHLFCFPHLEHRRSQGMGGREPAPQLKFHQKRLLYLQFQFLFSIFRLQQWLTTILKTRGPGSPQFNCCQLI